MLDVKTLISELTGRIGLYSGWESVGTVADQYQSPEAFLSDAHKLLRPDLLASLGPNLAAFNVRLYDQQLTFGMYEVVKSNEGSQVNYYESLIKENTNHLVTDEAYWRKTTLLSAWFARIERGSINKLVRLLAEAPPPKALLERNSLYRKESNLQGAINKSASFLALKLTLLGANTALNLARVGLQVTGPLTNMPMYLFHSESADPIAIILLSGNTSGRLIWANPNKYLFEQWTGYYLLGYFEADLPSDVRAIGGQRNFQLRGCGNCDPVESQASIDRSPYLHVQPVYVSNVGTSRQMVWSDETAVETQTWGINIVVEARCDVTQTLLANKDMLTSALLYTVACDVLEELSTSDRVNGVAAQLKSQAYVALYGQANSKTDFGLTTVRDKKVSELKAVMAKISPDCMAEKVEPETISFETMWD